MLKLATPLPHPPVLRPLCSFSCASNNAALASSLSKCTTLLVMLPIDCSAGCESCRYRPADLIISMSSCIELYLAEDTRLRSAFAVASETASGPEICPRRRRSERLMMSFCEVFSLMIVSKGAWCVNLGAGPPGVPAAMTSVMTW